MHYQEIDERQAQEEQDSAPAKPAVLRLQPGHVRVLKDEEFNRLTQAHIRETDETGNTENIFSIANYAVSTVSQRRRENESEYRKLEEAVTIGADNRCFLPEQKKAADQGKAWADILDRAVCWYNSSSNFLAMQKAVAEYAKFQKNLQNRLELANRAKLTEKKDFRLDLEAVVTPDDLEKMTSLAKKAKAAAEMYLDGERGKGQEPDGINSCINVRIDSAESVLQELDKVIRVRPYEKETAEMNKRRAEENLLRKTREIRAAKDINE